MSTPNPAPQFRPLTRKDMEDYEKELKATQDDQNVPQEPTPGPIDPPTPPAAKPDDTVDWKKRFSDQTAYLNEQIRLRKESDETAAELAKQLKQTTQKRYASDEEVATFEKEVTTTPVLKELIRREAARLNQETLAKIEEKETSSKAELRKQTEDVAKLSKAHPDWAQYDNGAPLHNIFAGWLDKQPATIQKLADYTATKDMDGAIAVLTMFKAEVQVAKPSGSPKQSSSTNPATRTIPELPAQKEGSLAVVKWGEDFDAAQRSGNKKLQAKLMEEMNKARAEGRLTY